MRPSGDKEIEVVHPDDLFSQYLESDLQLNHTMAETSGPDDLAHLFNFPSSLNGSEHWDSMPNWEATSDDAWHKALQVLEQNPASPVVPVASSSPSIYLESREKIIRSTPDLLSFDDLFESEPIERRQPASTPSTPKATTSPRSAKKVTSNPEKPQKSGIHKATKKLSTISKMMRASPFRTNLQDLWTRKLDAPADTFNLQLPNTPPQSVKLFEHQGTTNEFYAPQQQPAYTTPLSPFPDSTPEVSQANYQLTPLSSPAIDTTSRCSNGESYQFSNDSVNSAFCSQNMSNAALSALQTPPSSHRLQMSAWGPDTPASLDFAFSASPDYRAIPGKNQAWWPNAPVSTSQPSSSSYQTTQSHSAPQSRTQSQSLGYNSTPVNGLGISCDTSSFSGFNSDLGTVSTSNESSNDFSTSTSASSFDLGYTVMYPTTPGVPIGQPLNSSTPSRSPSMSPQPRFHRRRHSSNTHTTRAHRRKSSGSSQHSHSNGKTQSVGFVNFTPDDSRKILTGVAPSGSSKTKARREKEAAEKRRKLSQAAVKAVIEAGGDLARLEEGGLLNLGHE
ncbi:hypothetical protein BU24DRAFT_458274 [Aaosphaeria arxii CBS 175.79]|uniref:Uncharacterized protein n=1 Tax=Aaosphaeria arxii CBS 175.79 TaxID=1450172 RepID=A0A6A5YBJ3_9PLEO|nr:uncharacterized protein BU24DRAFT_458274 [Aaosphaeria arxii CBS 175.79]KAF2022417.1 hypothetical protein BU24DRAFT_458274 [Aaosphaeria arxii CBS 175.79]